MITNVIVEVLKEFIGAFTPIFMVVVTFFGMRALLADRKQVKQ